MATRDYVLRMRKKINQWRDSDQRAKQFFNDLEEQSQEIQNTFAEIQSLEQRFTDEQERTQELMKLNEAMEELNNYNKVCQEDYEEYAKNQEQFREFAQRYPGLFKMFLTKNVDNAALIHCLDTFTRLERGEIGIERGKEIGFEKYMKK